MYDPPHRKVKAEYMGKKKLMEELRLRCEVVMGGPSEKIDRFLDELSIAEHVAGSIIKLFSDLIWEAR